MRVSYTPELVAHVRHRYENTDDTLAKIAADCGVSERAINRMRDREGWTRRERPSAARPAAGDAGVAGGDGPAGGARDPFALRSSPRKRAPTSPTRRLPGFPLARE